MFEQKNRSGTREREIHVHELRQLSGAFVLPPAGHCGAAERPSTSSNSNRSASTNIRCQVAYSA